MADAWSIAPGPPPEPPETGLRAEPPPPRMQVLLEWLAGNPLVPPAIGLAAGIALDSARRLPTPAPLLLIVIAGIVTVRQRHADGIRHLALLTAALGLGAILHDTSFRRWPANAIVRYCGETITPARLTGTVLTAPLIRRPQTGRIEWFEQPPVTRMLVSAESLEGVTGPIAVEGLVAVKVNEPAEDPRAGDRVVLFGRLYRPGPPDSDEDRDWALIHRRRGVLVQMNCDHAENVTLLPREERTTGWRDVLTAVRKRARLAMLDAAWPGDVPGSNLLEALVLGQRSAVDPTLNQAFVDTGTVHYLSVSGAHVGMLAGALWYLAIPLGRSRRATAAGIAVVITAYGVLAEPNPPVWRSVIMGDVLCAAVMMRRPVRVANWLALSGMILLVLNPGDLFDPGFQLSFGTLTSLIYLGPPIGKGLLQVLRRLRGVSDPLLAPEIQRLFDPHPIRRVGWRIEHGVSVSLGVGIAAWLAGVAPGAYHFYQVPPWGWVNSLILALPVAWVLLLGLIKAVLSSIWPLLGVPFGPPLSWSTDRLIDLVYLLNRLPGSPAPPMHVTGLGVAAFMMILLMWMLRDWLRVPRRVLPLITGGFALLAAWRMAPPFRTGELRVDVLSVGSGSAHLVRLPNGRAFLYDAGARPPYDIQRWTLGPLLARGNIYTLDALAISHPDLDHFSAVPDVLARQRVRGVVTTELFRPLSYGAGPSGRLVRELDASHVRWKTLGRGDTLPGTGEVSVECLWPPPARELPATITTNDSSMVLRLTYRGHRILLCGDIEDYAQRRLISAGDVRADVLILPHHGAVTAFTRSLIAAVNPAWCIRSSGQHDRDTASGLLDAVRGRRYLNTADHGHVTITADARGLFVREMRPAR